MLKTLFRVQMIGEEDTPVDIIVKLNLNRKIKHKTRVIQNVYHGA